MRASRIPAREAGAHRIAEATHIRFEVTDSGPGIPTEHQAGLFEKFFRVPGSPEGGSGLGLFIAKGIVQAHGGEIGIESSGGTAPRSGSPSPSPRRRCEARSGLRLVGARRPTAALRQRVEVDAQDLRRPPPWSGPRRSRAGCARARSLEGESPAQLGAGSGRPSDLACAPGRRAARSAATARGSRRARWRCAARARCRASVVASAPARPRRESVARRAADRAREEREEAARQRQDVLAAARAAAGRGPR